VSSYEHLTFDRYDQDQTYSFDDEQSANGQMTRLAFIDEPTWPMTDIRKLPHRQWRNLLKTHPRSKPRLTMERALNGAVFLALKDKEGRTRVAPKVGPHGTL
jgi:hypothetical protein